MSYLIEIKACKDAQEWADAQTDYETAWNICENGDWMLWIARKQGVDKRKFTLAKARCAWLVKHLMKDERSINAVEVAEKYGLGEVTDEELDAAAAAARAAYAADADAAYAAYAAAAAAAAVAAATADAAAHAAAAADADAAYAAAATADADAAYAAAAAAAYFARKKTLKQCADIIRGIISFEDLNKALGAK